MLRIAHDPDVMRVVRMVENVATSFLPFTQQVLTAALRQALKRPVLAIMLFHPGVDDVTQRDFYAGAPSYFTKHEVPIRPQDLMNHDCINVRLPTLGGLLPWDFKKGKHELNVRVDGKFIFNGFPQVLNATLAGLGLVFILEEVVEEHIAKGELVRVLEDWCNPFPGYHRYYPNRRQHSQAFALVVASLRYSE